MTETFPEYPKTRPPLPEAIQRIYKAHYQENRSGGSPASSMAQRMEAWLHHQVAADLQTVADASQLRTLEVGAGNLNQLAYEPPSSAYDIIEPFDELYAGSSLLSRVRSVFRDIREVPEDARYDRITSVATFEHICDLPVVVARAGLLLEEGGTLRTSIPSEGTFLWTLGWQLTTGLEFRVRHGLDYGTLMRHEHVNNAAEIERVLDHFFRSRRCRVFGLSRGISLYRFYEHSDPDRDRCRTYLESLA